MTNETSDSQADTIGDQVVFAWWSPDRFSETDMTSLRDVYLWRHSFSTNVASPHAASLIPFQVVWGMLVESGGFCQNALRCFFTLLIQD